jgi:hypothetical protein
MTTKKSMSKAATPKCEPTWQKQRGIVRYRQRDSASPIPRVKLTENAASTTSPEPISQKQSGIVNRARNSASPIPRVRLTENGDSTTSTEPTSQKQSGIVRHSARDSADSTTSTKAFAGALSQDAFVNLVGPEIRISDPRLELMVSVLTNTKPRDQTEAMLLMQMADMHKAAMTYAHRLAQAKSIAEVELWERGLNRFARTFVAQFEALNRYRSGGEQRMTAPHVSVSQAIVANVTPAPREITPNETAASPPSLADSRMPPMTISHEPAPAPAQLKRGPSK